MSILTGWWVGKSNPAKVELYTRWSFHSFALVEVTAIGLAPVMQGVPRPTGITLFLLVCVHAVLCAVLCSRAMDWTLGRRKRPVRLLVAMAVFSGTATLAVLSLRAADGLRNTAVAATLTVGLSAFGVGALVLGLRRVRHMLCLFVGAAAGTGTATLAVGLPGNEAAGNAVGVFCASVGIAFTCGFSGWLLRAVWELDRARELQARLAVAEERLRFGRDLHDVMGRNLAVIALKSELAVQLARRDRPEAVEQMIEVQRIAQESQREVRDVVRGYREADLPAELEGASGVLTAAGIACAVESDCVPAGSDLSAGTQSALGWVVREATTNVLRHGDARRCTISLTTADGPAVLVVENDGAPVTAGARPGSGLAGLRERLTALDGTLDAGPAGDGVFRLTATVPLPSQTFDRRGTRRAPRARQGDEA
ncbi:histidine kinase [Streptomyces sp. NPDC051219]|uniref:sensor histidine kinase n=1 Tax=Streptomyces sp. NPDC051219 TaxID=3155283 RepID=UPI0034287F4C